MYSEWHDCMNIKDVAFSDGRELSADSASPPGAAFSSYRDRRLVSESGCRINFKSDVAVFTVCFYYPQVVKNQLMKF